MTTPDQEAIDVLALAVAEDEGLIGEEDAAIPDEYVEWCTNVAGFLHPILLRRFRSRGFDIVRKE
jgi:hypothetical protein